MIKNVNPNKRERTITLTEDLIGEWQKRTGKPRELLEEMLVLHYKYLDYAIDNEEKAIIINFPNLGKMSFNYLLSLRYANTQKYVTGIRKKLDKLIHLLETEGNNLLNFNSPMVARQIYMKTGRFPKGVYNKLYEYWNILEIDHNDNYRNKYEN